MPVASDVGLRNVQDLGVGCRTAQRFTCMSPTPSRCATSSGSATDPRSLHQSPPSSRRGFFSPPANARTGPLLASSPPTHRPIEENRHNDGKEKVGKILH
jgi:hypothetical protein